MFSRPARTSPRNLSARRCAICPRAAVLSDQSLRTLPCRTHGHCVQCTPNLRPFSQGCNHTSSAFNEPIRRWSTVGNCCQIQNSLQHRNRQRYTPNMKALRRRRATSSVVSSSCLQIASRSQYTFAGALRVSVTKDSKSLGA